MESYLIKLTLECMSTVHNYMYNGKLFRNLYTFAVQELQYCKLI